MKVIIVEDEYTIALDTELKLQANGFEVIGIAHDFNSLIDLISEDTPDVILMDINLGENISGIEIAQKIKKIIQVPIVFLSAYSNTEIVDAAFKTKPYGYLVKPYKIEDLIIAIKLAHSKWLSHQEIGRIDEASSTDKKVFIQSGNKLISVELNDILFVQALDNYSIIQTVKEKVIVSAYLSNLSQKLSGDNFFQVHRSYIVNLDRINTVDGNTIYIDKFEIPVSRSNKPLFLARLKVL